MIPSVNRSISRIGNIQDNNIGQQRGSSNQFAASITGSPSSIRRHNLSREFESRSSEENLFSHAEMGDGYANSQDITEKIDNIIKYFEKLKVLPDYIMEQMGNGNIEENLENGQLEKGLIALDNRYELSRTGVANACILLNEKAVAMIEQTVYTFSRNLRNLIDETDTESRSTSTGQLYHMVLLKIYALQKIIVEQNKNLDALKLPELKVKFSNSPIYRIARYYYLICGHDNYAPNTPFGLGNSFH